MAKENGRATETGWAPLQDSYEEAVLTWYEQIETSFRRRRLDSHRTRAAIIARPQVAVEAGQGAYD
jgi:hypothetical protein